MLKVQLLFLELNISSIFVLQSKLTLTKKAEWKIYNLYGRVRPVVNKEQEEQVEFVMVLFLGLYKKHFMINYKIIQHLKSNVLLLTN